MFNYIIFGGIDSRTLGLYFELETLSILTEEREYTLTVPGKDGVTDYGIGGREARIIPATAVYKGNISKLRKDREKIIAFLSTKKGKYKKLVLGSEPDRYYMAKVTGKLNFEIKADHHLGEIEFFCNPPWQYSESGLLMTPEIIEWNNCTMSDNQFIKEFLEDGSMRFSNAGTMEVKPIIKIFGNIKSGLELIFNDQKFKLIADVGKDGIAVDCNLLTVTRTSDGQDITEYVDETESDFFAIPPGNCEVFVSMPDIGVYPDCITVIFEFNPMLES